MDKDFVISTGIGTLSYVVFIGVMFSKGLGFIFGLGSAPLVYLFPQLNSPNAGLADLLVWLMSGFIGIALFPFALWCLAKVCKFKIKISGIVMGFLLSAIIANIIKLLFA